MRSFGEHAVDGLGPRALRRVDKQKHRFACQSMLTADGARNFNKNITDKLERMEALCKVSGPPVERATAALITCDFPGARRPMARIRLSQGGCSPRHGAAPDGGVARGRRRWESSSSRRLR